MAEASVVTQGHLWDPWGGNLTQTVSLGHFLEQMTAG